MKRLYQPALVGVLVLAMVTSGMMPRTTTALAATPGKSDQASSVLYRWKFPAAGQSGAWTFTKGVLSYDGESNAFLFAPFRLKHVADFALQATMRGLGSGGPAANLIGFGLTVRQKVGDPHAGISGGSFFASNLEDNNPEIYWNGDTVGGAAFDPKSSWHVYRLEVRGDVYTVLIDGKKVVEYTIDDYPYPVQVGIFSRYYKIQVKNFQVFALSAPAASPAVLPPVKQFTLTVSDLPTTTFYQPYIRHYYTNEEVARRRGASLSLVQSSGRIISYGTDFFADGRDIVDIFSSVIAFKTPDAARADIPVRLAATRQQIPSGVTVHDLPAGQVGEMSAGYSFDYDPGGAPATFVLLYFARGSYQGELTLAFNAGILTSDQIRAYTINLAKIVDQRLSAASY